MNITDYYLFQLSTNRLPTFNAGEEIILTRGETNMPIISVKQDVYNTIIRNIDDDDINGFVNMTLRDALKMKISERVEKK